MAYNVNGNRYERALLQYVPHGIDSNVFCPVEHNNDRLVDIRKRLFGDKKYDFVVFFNSRNTYRKRASNLLLAFRNLCDKLTPEQAKKCCLLLHTERRCDAGTDLVACKEAFCKDYDVIFSEAKVPPDQMNLLYNLADVTVNCSTNEGFGLSAAESVMAGTPTVVIVTGGLQDQIGQFDENDQPVKFDLHFGSNSIKKYETHGVWTKPVWPNSRCVQGSIPTPYIFDDMYKWEDLAESLMYWYLMPKDKRELCGLKGREWQLGEGGLNSKNMSKQFINCVDWMFDHWTPPKKLDVYTVEKDYVGNQMPFDCTGFDFPDFDINKLNNEVNKTVASLG